MTANGSTPRIICLGEGMVEERVSADGALSTHYGGDTLNTAIHLARFGFDVAFATAIGQDTRSDALVAAWQAEGVDTSLIIRHPTRSVGSYGITVDEKGERSFSYNRSASAAREMFTLDQCADWPSAIAQADCFLFSHISLAILNEDGRRALLELPRRSRLTAYDGNYRPALWESAQAARLWHDQAIGVADVGLPTLEDEAALRGEASCGSADDVCALWQAQGCAEVLVKAGAAGCRLPDGSMLAPPEELSPVDTSGAGDAFNAGYLAARLRGCEHRTAALAAHRLAGWTIMRTGAIPPSDSEAPYGANW